MDTTVKVACSTNPEYGAQFLKLLDHKLVYINIKVWREIRNGENEFEIIGETKINMDHFKHFNETMDIHLQHSIHVSDNIKNNVNVFGSIKVRISKDNVNTVTNLPHTITNYNDLKQILLHYVKHGLIEPFSYVLLFSENIYIYRYLHGQKRGNYSY